jgi:hypothetical protein
MRPNAPSFQNLLQAASSNQERAAFRGRFIKQCGTEALEAFDWLVLKGCNAEELITVLAALATGYEYHWPWESGRNRSPMRFDELFGFDRDSLGTVLNRMKQCAEDMEMLLARLGRDEIHKAARAACTERMQSLREGEPLPGTNPEALDEAVALGAEITSVGPSFAVELADIPARLRLFSAAVKKLSAEADLRSRPLYDEALEAIMRLVIRGTKQEQYTKVAALVGAVRGSYYDPATLKTWWTKRRSPSRR